MIYTIIYKLNGIISMIIWNSSNDSNEAAKLAKSFLLQTHPEQNIEMIALVKGKQIEGTTLFVEKKEEAKNYGYDYEYDKDLHWNIF